MARQLEGGTPEAQISEIIRSRCPLAFGSKFGVSTLAWLPDDSVLLTPGVRVFAAGTLEGYGPLPPEAGALKMRLHGPRNHAVTPPARCQAAPVVLSVLTIAMPNLNPRVADSAHDVGCIVKEEVSSQPPICTAIHALGTWTLHEKMSRNKRLCHSASPFPRSPTARCAGCPRTSCKSS